VGLWIIRPIGVSAGHWEPWYDKSFGFVVVADTEEEARALASDYAGDEGSAVWLDDTETSCEVLDDDGEPRVVIRDFASA
jgi:hypothetical protein